jgi:hypothetical protein
MPESATHQRYRSRVEQLEMHLEAMDAAARIAFNILGKEKHKEKLISDALPIESSQYSRLNHPTSHRSRVYNYCRAKNTQSAIIELHGFFSEYMCDILKEIYKTKPLLVVGKSNRQLDLKYHELIKYTNLQDLHTKMVNDVFRNIENEQSTIKLIDKILNNTDANVSEGEKNRALPYLEMRHLFIHNKGYADGAFADKYGAQFKVKCGDKLPTKFKIADDAIANVSALTQKIDSEFLRLGLVNPLE